MDGEGEWRVHRWMERESGGCERKVGKGSRRRGWKERVERGRVGEVEEERVEEEGEWRKEGEEHEEGQRERVECGGILGEREERGEGQEGSRYTHPEPLKTSCDSSTIFHKRTVRSLPPTVMAFSPIMASIDCTPS